MSTLIVGQVTWQGTRMAGNPQSERGQWEETIITVLNGRHTVDVKVGYKDPSRFGGSIPVAGEVVALEVAVDQYLDRQGKPGYKWVTFGRNVQVEKALTTAENPGLAAVV